MQFQYLPLTRPPRVSLAHHRATSHNLNQNAWEVARPFVVRGIAFDAYSVDVMCTVSLFERYRYFGLLNSLTVGIGNAEVVRSR